MNGRHEERTRRLGEIIARQEPPAGEPFDCPYLPGRTARTVTLLPSPLNPGLYHSLMDLNFRRLGSVFYRPTCEECHECRMIRVPVEEFRPSRAQRRSWARNQDLVVTAGPPAPSEEKHALYQSYLARRHDGQMDGSEQELSSFLYASPIDTLEVTFRAGERLLGVSIADCEPLALSAVYFYFEPTETARSLGVFNVLWLIEECRRRGLPFLYLGYYVQESPKMAYKADYRPHQLLARDGTWTRPECAG